MYNSYIIHFFNLKGKNSVFCPLLKTHSPGVQPSPQFNFTTFSHTPSLKEIPHLSALHFAPSPFCLYRFVHSGQVINRITHYMTFCDQHPLFSLLFSRFIHTVPYISTSKKPPLYSYTHLLYPFTSGWAPGMFPCSVVSDSFETPRTGAC